MEFIRSYFECFKNAGMDTVFEIWRMQGKKKLAKFPFDHIDYDGISAVAEMARKFPAEGFAAPMIYAKPKPALLKRFWELMRWYARFYPFKPSKWKIFSTHKQETVSGMTEVPGWNLPHPIISINTRLLLALDQTSREYLRNPKQARAWMTPVGIYHGVERDIVPLNRVSFIDVKIKDRSTPQEIQKQIKQELQRCNYWGTILTMYFSVFFGKRFFSTLAKYIHLAFRRTGTFSNMGEWTIPGVAEDEWWVFGVGSVALMSPVDGTAIVVNGKMGISAHFHSSLGLSTEEAQEFVDKWKANYLAWQSPMESSPASPS